MVFSIIFFSTLPLLAQTDTAWVRTYSGPYYTDWVTDIAVDGIGNVYVTGRSVKSSSTMEYATLKYYPNGDTAWVRRYCDSTNVMAGTNDLAIDDSGNVYVTGFSYSEIYEEYATIKYYPNGDTAWLRKYHGKDYRYNCGISIAVDDSLNVYVTGASSGNGIYDYGTIKYYPNGDTGWVRIYDGPPQSYDVPYDLELDSAGNIYITGISYGGSSSSYDYATVKYYPNGDTGWVRRYNGPEGNMDKPLDLAVDDSGNAYVTGHSYSSQTKWDYLTIKYRYNGDTAWVRRFNGTSDYLDSAMAIAVDSRGNVYIMGSNYADGTGLDYVLIKYSPDGKFIWEKRYNGTGNSSDNAKDMIIDNSDNIYVTGYSLNSGGANDFVTIKYSSDGSCHCTRRYRGSPSFIIDMTVDSAQNVYVAGNTDDFVTIKYYPIILAGDANSDGSLSVSDPVFLINYIFKSGPAPNPTGLGDVNDDEFVNVSDIVYLINYLFKGGPPPIC